MMSGAPLAALVDVPPNVTKGETLPAPRPT